MRKREEKLSEIIVEIAKISLIDQKYEHHKVMHILTFLAHVAWNRVLLNGNYQAHGEYQSFIKQIGLDRIVLEKTLVSTNWEALIDGMMQYKRKHHPNDQRFIGGIGSTKKGHLRVVWAYLDQLGIVERHSVISAAWKMLSD